MAASTQNVPAALAAYNQMISGMSPTDIMSLNAMLQASGYWTGQTGFVTGLGTVPAVGTPSTTEQQVTGYYVDPITGERKPTLAGQEAYGGSATDPTLKAMEDIGVVNGPNGPTNTVGRDTLNAQAGQNALDLISRLRGPKDAFTQQAVLHGLNASGLSRAVDAIQGKYGLPTFSAPNANPQAASLQTLMDQVGGVQGNFVTTPNGQQTPEAATQDVAWKQGDKIYTDGNGYSFVQVSTPTGANWVATGQRSAFAPNSFNVAGSDGTSAAGTYTGQPSGGPSAPSPSSLSGPSWTGAGSTYTNAPASSGAINANPGAAPTSDGSGINPADGGTTVFGGTHIHVNGTNAAGGASTLDPTTAAYVNALPNPNKINGPNWQTLDDNTKQFLLGAYQSAGYDPGDVTSAVSAGLPQFKAPSAGLVGASGQLSG